MPLPLLFFQWCDLTVYIVVERKTSQVPICLQAGCCIRDQRNMQKARSLRPLHSTGTFFQLITVSNRNKIVVNMLDVRTTCNVAWCRVKHIADVYESSEDIGKMKEKNNHVTELYKR